MVGGLVTAITITTAAIAFTCSNWRSKVNRQKKLDAAVERFAKKLEEELRVEEQRMVYPETGYQERCIM